MEGSQNHAWNIPSMYLVAKGAEDSGQRYEPECRFHGMHLAENCAKDTRECHGAILCVL